MMMGGMTRIGAGRRARVMAVCLTAWEEREGGREGKKEEGREEGGREGGRERVCNTSKIAW